MVSVSTRFHYNRLRDFPKRPPKSNVVVAYKTLLLRFKPRFWIVENEVTKHGRSKDTRMFSYPFARARVCVCVDVGGCGCGCVWVWVCGCGCVWVWVCGCGFVNVGVWMWVCGCGCVDAGVCVCVGPTNIVFRETWCTNQCNIDQRSAAFSILNVWLWICLLGWNCRDANLTIMLTDTVTDRMLMKTEWRVVYNDFTKIS
jgi:hypothetical protein